MRLRLIRTGGAAGMRLSTTVDTQSLRAGDAQHIEELVRAADVFRLRSDSIADTTLRDHYQYELCVEEGRKEHTITVTEFAVPASLRPLVDELVKYARKRAPL